VKLTVLGGGGVRIPALVRAVVGDRPTPFDRIDLFEPDQLRRTTIGRLASAAATALGYPDVVNVTDDVEQALTGADYVFSAIRVGGDDARIVDERLALKHGLVGQETTGPGGCAMALRTIPVVLSYCEVISRVAPHAVLINFTNPAGIITQAVTTNSNVRALGVCDTPSGAQARLAGFLGIDADRIAFSYGGLNHLGWITSAIIDGEERIDELLTRYDELKEFNSRFAGFDTGLVRKIGAIPTEYLYYFYDSQACARSVSRSGTTRGENVRRFNEQLITSVAKAFETGDVNDAWAAYSQVMGARHDSYMRLDIGKTKASDGPQAGTPDRLDAPAGQIGGYSGVALRVIDGLSGAAPAPVIVNTRNGRSLDFLDPEDVVEVPALIDTRGVSPLATQPLPGQARGLVQQVKEYERAVVEAAVTGELETATLALAMNPLVPGVTAARELMEEYLEHHGPYLEYLQ